MKYCLFLALAALPALAADTVRIGNLVVTLNGLSATRALPNFGGPNPGGSIQAFPGNHFIVAHLHLENSGPYPNCVVFEPELRADFGERIRTELWPRSQGQFQG